MFAGLTAGAVAAIAAVLASLPLRSPSDTLLNSASVALAALMAGVLSGLLWLALRRTSRPTLWFLAAWSAIFLPASAFVLFLGQSQLDGFVSFASPLGPDHLRGYRTVDPGHPQVYSRASLVARRGGGGRGRGGGLRAGHPIGPGERPAGTPSTGLPQPAGRSPLGTRGLTASCFNFNESSTRLTESKTRAVVRICEQY